jgi:hypothetical protein
LKRQNGRLSDLSKTVWLMMQFKIEMRVNETVLLGKSKQWNRGTAYYSHLPLITGGTI